MPVSGLSLRNSDSVAMVPWNLRESLGQMPEVFRESQLEQGFFEAWLMIISHKNIHEYVGDHDPPEIPFLKFIPMVRPGGTTTVPPRCQLLVNNPRNYRRVLNHRKNHEKLWQF